MRKFWTLITFSCLFFHIQAQVKDKNYRFLKINFDEARVYLYDGYFGQLIVEKGKLDSTVINKKGYKLSTYELKQLDDLFYNRYHNDDTIQFICDPAFCFHPKHGVVFYKKGCSYWTNIYLLWMQSYQQ